MFFLLLSSLHHRVCAQPAADTLVVSDIVGKVIDPQEHDKYNLFRAYTDFESATFLKLASGDTVVSIVYRDAETGELCETPEIISRGFVFLRDAAEIIEAGDGDDAIVLSQGRTRETAPLRVGVDGIG